MRLPAGARLGRYEVIAHLGSGGMGDVYRARDTHLDRPVALKTIGTAYARDAAAEPRFYRERQLSAALNHPHICRLLDAGREGAIEYLTMEFLEGESLAARLTRGPLPVAEAIGYGIEIADALDYAHRHGVIHRDLKPANVFLTPAGAKVLDFGLAKLRPTGDDAVATAAGEDTVPLEATRAGTVIGSAPYMAPERLEGRDADHRTDIFGFGTLLYEMLTGRRAFDGASPAALVASILSAEPPVLRLDHVKGPELDWVIRRCLAKGPDDRWQSMADVGAVLRRLAATEPAAASSDPGLRKGRAAPALILVAVLSLLLWTLGPHRAGSGADEPLHVPIYPPAGGGFTRTEGSIQTAQLALAPDGRALVFVAAGADGVSRLWIRRLSSAGPEPIGGTEGASFPFWSADGRSIGFFAERQLRTIDLGGGGAQSLAAARSGRGGTWNAAGDILFAPEGAGRKPTIYRVSAGNGAVVPVTVLDRSRGHNSHRWPQFLPDGRRFIFFAQTTSGHEAHAGIYLTSLDGDSPRLLVNTTAGGVVLPPNRLLYLSAGTLLARELDLERAAPVGEPVALATRVGESSNFYGAFSAAIGALAYAGSAPNSDVAWFDRAGRPLEVVSGERQHVDFRLSPDESTLAASFADPARVNPRADIVLLDLLRPPGRKRLTFDPATDASPVWSPDGLRVVFRSNRQSAHDLYVVDARSRTEAALYHSDVGKYPTSWSPDGRMIAFHEPKDTTSAQTDYDILQIPATGGKPSALVQRADNDVQGQYSPDGQWLAYASNVTGRFEVWVKKLGADHETQISLKGGSDPRWRGDGGELFYVSADGHLTSVRLRYDGARIAIGGSERLFPIPSTVASPPFTSVYEVRRDGQQFLISTPREDVRSAPLMLILNPPAGTRRTSK